MARPRDKTRTRTVQAVSWDMVTQRRAGCLTFPGADRNGDPPSSCAGPNHIIAKNSVAAKLGLPASRFGSSLSASHRERPSAGSLAVFDAFGIPRTQDHQKSF